MKHQEMRENTSRAIMDAFWSLYRELPIEKITVEAICEKAACNRSTFYDYYTDSYSVLEAIEEELLDFVRRKLAEELPASLAKSFPKIRLDAETLAPLSDMYNKRGEYFSILTGEKGDPYFQYKYKQTVKELLTQMLDDPAKKFDLSASIVAEFTASALIGAFNCWYPHREEYPAEKYALLLVSLLTNGVLPAIRKL